MEAAPNRYTSTAILQGIDVGGQLYLSWEWWSWDQHATEGGFTTPDPVRLASAIGELLRSLPSSSRGTVRELRSCVRSSPLFDRAGAFTQRVDVLEQAADISMVELQELAMVANVAKGLLASAEGESGLASKLGQLLLPKELTDRLRNENLRTPTPDVLIQVLPSKSCARVPWEILRTGNPDLPDERLIELGDVVTMAPLLARDGDPDRRHPCWGESSGKPLRVIDPDLGPGRSLQVLSCQQAKGWQDRIDRDGQPALRAGEAITVQDLTDALLTQPRPSRLLFVGHVDSGRSSWEIALRLSGVAGGVRGQTAFEVFVLEGTNDSERGTHTDSWPIPPRVALVACNSGPDLGFIEPFGLVTAYLEHGAELATATRWTMLTDTAFELMGGASSPLNELAIAVDEAHETRDPVRELCNWQRTRLNAWRRSGEIGDSPLTWAAVSNWVAPDRTIRPHADNQQS